MCLSKPEDASLQQNLLIPHKLLYNNEYALFIDIYFYEYFHLVLALQTFLDTLPTFKISVYASL